MITFVKPSIKMAMPSSSPAIAPRSANWGWVAVGTRGDVDLDAIEDGRRVGDKIGRSLVAFNDARGIDHKRLPRFADV
jgi:hypothetical protein